MRLQGRFILLLCDNAPCHIHNPADYPNIRIEFFAPKLTAWIQPMDAGIIRCFKSHYKRAFVRLAIARDDAGIEHPYNINQREAMELASAAWNAVSPTTIANCWRHTAILQPLPIPPTALVQSAAEEAEERELEAQIASHPNLLDNEFQRLLESLTLDGPTEGERSEQEIVDGLEYST